MMSQVAPVAKSLLSSLKLEFHANPRIRRLTWLIGYILVLYIVLALSDFNTSLRTESTAMQAEIARIMRGSETTGVVWHERLSQEESLQQQLIQSCWTAKDARLASADMQTELQKFYRNFDLKNSRLALSDPEALKLSEGGTAWVIRGDIKGRIKLNRLPSLVNALEHGKNRFFVQEVRFVRQRSAGTLDMLLSACFVQGDRNGMGVSDE